MNAWQYYQCSTSFREKNDPNCICKVATHGHWKFGDCEIFDICCDTITTVHKFAFEQNNFDDCDDYLQKDNANSHFINCDCIYCKSVSNKIHDYHEFCFCCKEKIYTPNEHILHCADCNSVICDKCYIHGRYRDDVYCFECRRFSIHKNARYYFKNSEPNVFNMDDDWDNASWYY